MTRYDDLRGLIDDVDRDPQRAAVMEEAQQAKARGADPEVTVGYVRALARDLAVLRDLRQALARCESATERALAEVMPKARLDLGDMALVRHGGRKRVDWDHDGVIAALARRFATDPETGEYDETKPELFGDAVRFLRQAVTIDDYRTKTGLVPLGIDPGDYSRTVPAHRTVRVIAAGDLDGEGDAA